MRGGVSDWIGRRLWWAGVPALVAGAGAWAALADDKAGWTVVSASAAAVLGAFGPTVTDRWARRRERSDERSRSLQRVVSAELPESVAWLLHPRRQVVPFFGRGWILRELESWLTDRAATAVRLLVGAGGVGKTRLALQLAGRVPGWQVILVRPEAEAETAELIVSGASRERQLLLVDYAETRDRAGLAALLCAAQQAGARVLLLSRVAGLWWETLSAAYPQQAHLVDALTGPAGVVELSAQVEEGSPDQVVAQAAAAFADRLGRPAVAVPARGWDVDTPVLRLHAAALVAVLGGAYRQDRVDVLAEVLGHEARYWRGAARRAGLVAGAQPGSDAVLQELVGLAALLGADGDEQAADVVGRVPALSDADEELVHRYTGWLTGLYPRDPAGGGWVGVQPDLLAEALAVRVLSGYRPVMLSALFTGASLEQAVRALTVLGRACAHQPGADAIIDVVLAADVVLMARAVVRVAVQFPGRFTTRMTVLLATADIDWPALCAVAEQVPYPTLELGRLAAALTSRIVSTFPSGTSAAERARWVHRHAMRLNQVGQRDEAMAASQDAVGLRRELAADDRGAHLGNLAGSVANHAIHLAQAGRRAESLAASQEAVDLYRELVEHDRDAHLPDLAASLDNHAGRLADAGRRDEVMAASQEAVDLRRELAADNPQAHLPALARSVNNHAVRLANVDRVEALAAGQEGVDLYRKLAEHDPDAHLPDLAWSVSNYAVRLAEAGRRVEAMEASRQAVELRRRLAADNRDAYLPDLASSLNNHAIRLVEAGRPVEAMAAGQEAVDLHRELAEGNLEVYLPGLAASVNNYAAQLAGVGRDAEALVASRQAVDLRRELATSNRNVYLPDLATSVRNHAIQLGRAGQGGEALVTGRQAVDLYRELVADNRDAHLPGLANALWNVGSIALVSGEIDDDVIALTAEGVAYFDELGAEQPATFGDQRAGAAATLANLCQARDASS